MATETPRRTIRDPDSDSDSELFPTPITTPLSKSTTAARRMEFLDSHSVPVRPKVQAGQRVREVVDLTDSPPVPAVRHLATGSSSTPSNGTHRSHASVPSQNHHGTHGSYKSTQSQPLAPSYSSNKPPAMDEFDRPFGSSILTAKKGKPSSGFGSIIKPATPNAFKSYSGPASSSQPSHFQRASAAASTAGSTASWPSWLVEGRPAPFVAPSDTPGRLPAHHGVKSSKTTGGEDDRVEREVFDLNVGATAEDYERHNGDADEHMRELLSGAIGDGEGEMGDDRIEDGDDVIEGFAKGIRLMPHQVRGTKWMKGRESGRKYGGILADDMGLGKTVQTLARIVDGKATAAEKKAGHRGGTLIVAPLAVMEQWATEVSTKTAPGALKVTTHHGPSPGKVLEKYDVVITTFQTLASEFKVYEDLGRAAVESDSSESETFGRRTLKSKKKAKTFASAIFEVKWLRVVIDEAQNIKNRNTRAAKAAVGLRSKYRWCLTGTPIQNNVEELYSLFHFLRARPLDEWEVFRNRIAAPIKNGQTKLAMKRLHVLLKAVMLRRTKDATIDGKPILNLPGRTVQIVQCPFDKEEREFYTALEKKTELRLNKFVKSGTVMSNYTSVLTMLLRLRQVCDHPSLVASALSVDADALENKGAQSQAEPDHADELADLLGGLIVDKGKTCELCYVKLEPGLEKHCSECSEIAKKAKAKLRPDSDVIDSSAKIRKLLEIVLDIERRSGQKEKTIVFSQFTSFLNLIEPFLRAEGIKFVRFDGAMRNDKRSEALHIIKTDPSVRLILISFKAGSTGLNLTCCNNVILMDLWWNPALEDQAFDRAHRLGQKLDVNIYKLTVQDTVENRILALQDAKRELAKAALSGNAKNLTKLTLADIMALFKSDRPQLDADGSDSD